MDRGCFWPFKYRHRETVQGRFFQGLCFDVCLFLFTCYSTVFVDRGSHVKAVLSTILKPMKLRLPSNHCRMCYSHLETMRGS
jgi:hypothetical protein